LLEAPAVEQSTSPAVQPAPAAPAQDNELPALPPNEPGKSSTDEGN
jgi:hypothetical protein